MNCSWDVVWNGCVFLGACDVDKTAELKVVDYSCVRALKLNHFFNRAIKLDDGTEYFEDKVRCQHEGFEAMLSQGMVYSHPLGVPVFGSETSVS